MSETNKDRLRLNRRNFLKGASASATLLAQGGFVVLNKGGAFGEILQVVEETPTPTNTLPPPTATNTPAVAATNTPLPTATNTPMPAATNTPLPTATNTPIPAATNTPLPTATNTPLPAATNTPLPTATNTPLPAATATNTPLPTATNTPEPTMGPTETPLPTITTEPTATVAPTSTPNPHAPALPPLFVIAFSRMGYGITPNSRAEFEALGSTDNERFTAFVDQQLNPSAIDDSACDAIIASAGFTRLNMSRTQLWTQYYRADNNRDRWIPRDEVERSMMNRAIYSKRQLQETMIEFWHDHFNVAANDSRIAATFPTYHSIFRTHAFGNFRTMLEEVAKDSCMLYYLDNLNNSRSGPNENWARELFELHTMGAENYLGVLKQGEVPVDENGTPIGYVDDDVYEATLCFTGWTMDDSDRKGTDSGDYLYLPDWHDLSQKWVLGVNFPFGGQESNGTQVLDILAAHPGTGRHIARKLCTRFIGQNPPESLVQSAGAIFTANVNAPDQIAQVMRHILLSDEFKTTWGGKSKRPYDLMASFMRATEAQLVFKLDHEQSGNFIGWFDNAGHRLFHWSGPDGYPDEIAPWQSTTPRLQMWRFINYFMDRQTRDEDSQITTPDLSGNYYVDVLSNIPADVRTANELTDFWIDRILGRPIDAESRDILLDLIADGSNPDFNLPLDADEDLQRLLRTFVATICFTPDFLWK